MFPGEKALVERQRGRPFTLLGVNCDERQGIGAARRHQQKLNWRSWFDASGSDRDSLGSGRVPADVPDRPPRGDPKKWEGFTEARSIAAVEELLKQAEAAKSGK